MNQIVLTGMTNTTSMVMVYLLFAVIWLIRQEEHQDKGPEVSILLSIVQLINHLCAMYKFRLLHKINTLYWCSGCFVIGAS
jgi:hypothetical protein